ncbi:hypothetical protein ACVBGC_17205 [Burkholderia stagnalis]
MSLVAAGRGVAIAPGFASTPRRPCIAYVPIAKTGTVELIVS